MNKETANYAIPKADLDYLKHTEKLSDYIVEHITKQLADRVSDILSQNGEIIVRQSDVRVEENLPLNYVGYRRSVTWDRLVRCKDCEFYTEEEKWCRRLCLCGAFDGDGFCSHSERRNDG